MGCACRKVCELLAKNATFGVFGFKSSGYIRFSCLKKKKNRREKVGSEKEKEKKEEEKKLER